MSTPGIPKAPPTRPSGPATSQAAPRPAPPPPPPSGSSRTTAPRSSVPPPPSAPKPPLSGASGAAPSAASATPRSAPQAASTPPAAPGYTPPRVATPRATAGAVPAPPEALNLGPVEPAPWDDLNFSMPPTPPPVPVPDAGYGGAASGAGGYGYSDPGAIASAGYGSGANDGGYGGPATGYGAAPVTAYGAPAAAPYAAPPSAPAPQGGWGQSAWSNPPMPNPDSLLGRTAAKTGGWGKTNDAFDTETISTAKLKGIRRRGRYGWLLAFLSTAALAGGVALALEERQRLQNAIAHERDLVAQAQAQVAEAAKQSDEARSDLTKMKDELASRDTTSPEDQKLLATFKAQLPQKEGDVEAAARAISLSVLDDVMFDAGKTELSLNGYRVLARLGKVLKETPDKNVAVGVHTDDKPLKKSEFATKWELSAARAVSVTRYLVEEIGLAPDRVSAAAFAQYHPRGKNAARNGRVELLLTPLAKGEQKPAQ